MKTSLTKYLLLSMTLGLSTPAIAADFLGGGAAQKLYKKHCGSCHGKEMEGGMAGSLLDDEWLLGDSDKHINQAISKGIPDSSMPGWEKRLNQEEIRTLVLLIREKRYLASQAKHGSSVSTSKDGAEHFRSQHHNYTLTTIAKAKDIIWAFDFLPDNTLIYTEKRGKLWLNKNNKTSEVKGIPEVWHHDQGGLLDVAVHPDYKKNGWVYLSFSHKTGKNTSGRAVGALAVVRGKIKGQQWVDNEWVYLQPKDTHINRGWHFGSRFAFKDDYLFFSIGDEGYQEMAQDLSRHNGKIHRIHHDGKIPRDNPFVNTSNAVASIWTYGNRNPQGLTVAPSSGKLWSSEHGPRGGDEINLLKKSENYGWPEVTYGMNYNGTPMDAVTENPGTQAPIHYWTPSIAVSGINFYHGDMFPKWKNQLFAGSLAFQELHRLKIDGERIVEDEIILKDKGRIRDVATAPDGSLYIAVNNKENKRFEVISLKPIQ